MNIMKYMNATDIFDLWIANETRFDVIDGT